MRDLRGLKVLHLKDFKVSPFSIKLLGSLEQAGIDNPILFGGALRDQWMDIEINDYDIWGHWEKIIDSSILPARNANKMITALKAAIPGLSQMNHRVSHRKTDKEQWAEYQFAFMYEDHKISLFIDHILLSLEDKIRGDAPINTIVMDSSGKILAHPLFETHAAQKTFQPYNHHDPAEDERRFIKLQKKIPGLKYSWSSWLQLNDFYNANLTDKTNIDRQTQ